MERTLLMCGESERPTMDEDGIERIVNGKTPLNVLQAVRQRGRNREEANKPASVYEME